MSRANAQAGNGATMATLELGQALSASRRRKWRHPWQTGVSWIAELERWVAVIEPGFVNEETPVVFTTQREQARTGRDFGTNPLTGEPYFSASVFSPEVTTPEVDREVRAPLYLDPAIVLHFRAIGFDGPTGAAVPDFFLDRGAKESPAGQDFTDPDAVLDFTPEEAPRGLRLLRACDLVLHQPRTALSSQIALLDGPATGISNVTQTLTLRAKMQGDALRIFAGTFTPTTGQIDGIAGGLVGIYEEEPWDELLISTVYLLSPPDTTPGSEPDGTWQPFVQHALFWNLNYSTPVLRVLDSDPGLPFIPPLAGGAAQIIINFLTATINDAARQALNILTAHSLTGTFWTPTGGGSTAKFPEASITTPSAGLDKGKQLQALRLAELRRIVSQKLDPAFPFVTRPFDPSLLAGAAPVEAPMFFPAAA